mgnify:CR=1 FL=1
MSITKETKQSLISEFSINENDTGSSEFGNTSHMLTPDQVRQFEELGYLFLPGTFSPEEMDVLREELPEDGILVDEVTQTGFASWSRCAFAWGHSPCRS